MRQAFHSKKSILQRTRHAGSKAVSAFAMFLMVSCSAGHFSAKNKGYHPPGSFARQNLFFARQAETRKKPRCTLSNNTLSCSANGTEQSVLLDITVEGKSRLLCSESFTVILSSEVAVVTLGIEKIMAGRGMLGSIDGAFFPANSYELEMMKPASEGIEKAEIHGSMFTVRTSKGNEWTIDLSCPGKGWYIY
ncbi:hypothetical protein GF318_05960 [Candidatus Micrarchaeota archaeon]|nr:hypothetical protein [Candidatus Micrarchaeota archaeon]